MNAEIAGHAGTLRSKLLNTVNIEMFRHPNYYKELRKLRNKLDQVISETKPTGDGERAPGPGLKLQASEDSTANSTRGRVAEPQASSLKPQASEGTSDKPQAPSSKPQASSQMNQEP